MKTGDIRVNSARRNANSDSLVPRLLVRFAVPESPVSSRWCAFVSHITETSLICQTQLTNLAPQSSQNYEISCFGLPCVLQRSSFLDPPPLSTHCIPVNNRWLNIYTCLTMYFGCASVSGAHVGVCARVSVCGDVFCRACFSVRHSALYTGPVFLTTVGRPDEGMGKNLLCLGKGLKRSTLRSTLSIFTGDLPKFCVR